MKHSKENLRILFVCKGNVFRSMSAKYCLEKYLKDNKIKNIIADSAGIEAKKQSITPVVLKTLKKFGIDASSHKQKKINKRMLEKNILVIAMAQEHQNFIYKKFKKQVPLFLNVCFNLSASLPDIEEAIKHWENEPALVEEYAKETVIFIHNSIPKLVEHISKFL